MYDRISLTGVDLIFGSPQHPTGALEDLGNTVDVLADQAAEEERDRTPADSAV